MPIQSDLPLGLLLLAGAVYLAACYLFWHLHRRSVTDMSPGRKRLALALRLVIVTCLFLAITGMHWVRRSDSLTAVFVMDASRSLRDDQKEAELKFVKDALAGKQSTDTAGVVTFGANAETQSAPAPQIAISGLHHSGVTNATNIEQALSYGLSLISNNSAGKVVVLSDFNENVGSALGEVPALAARGVRTDSLLLNSSLKKEALIEKLVVPSRVKIGEPFSVRVVLNALNAQRGRIRLMQNGQPLGAPRAVDIPAGRRVHSFEVHLDKPGFYRFEAQLDTDPAQDTVPDNNKGLGFVSVRGRPQILYVAPDPGMADFLRRSLKAQNIDVLYAPPGSLPTSPAALQPFDSLILSDTPRPMLSESQMSAIQVAVRDFGMGFGMVGGENSFGAGGYRNTAIEETLPVSLEVKKQKRLPSVAVVLVIEDLEIETSVNMSKEAAKALVDLLDPIDEVGVLDCNGWGGPGQSSPNGSWRIPLQHCLDRAGIRQAIDKLEGMGDPPNYDPYLIEAANRLASSDAKVKHIVFLGDGDAIMEQSQGGMKATLQKIQNMGITVSTVASGADQTGIAFMASIASDGGGHAYVADQPKDLPRILLKDQQTISQPPIKELPFQPVQTPGDEILSGLGGFPILLGNNVTSPRETANVSLVANDKDHDPILATWRYGLGRSMAFMSDDKNKWAVHWLPWQGFGQFWAQAARWTMRSFTPSDFQTQVTTEGNRGHIVVDAIDKNGKFVNRLAFTARVAGPDAGDMQSTDQIPLRQTGPGHYEAWFDAAKVGTYLVNVTRPLAGKPAEMAVTGLVVPYSPEYRDLASNEFLATQIAQAGSGSVLAQPSQVFGGMRPSVSVPYPLAPWLLLASLLLLPIDIGVRRLALQRDDFDRLATWIRGRVRPSSQRQRTAATPELGRLMGAKHRTGTRREEPLDGAPEAPAQPTPRPATEPRHAPARPANPPRPTEPRAHTIGSSKAPPAAAQEEPPAPEAADEAEETTMTRLMEAKRRAREQQKKEEN